MPRVLAAIALIALFVYGLVDCIRTDHRDVRAISKTAWIVVMVVLPVLGAVMWLIFGRPRGLQAPASYPGHPTAPDDDPMFLRNLETRRRQQAETERLRRIRGEIEARERKLRRENPDSDKPSS
ncbi:PLDc N-terminal domain-containing protein [Paenarthrobacter sp. DKR-5]|uniref:PLD nuclease N-terminal domain-containing protein n=1 Tax=Paenarthrobacter sp. DKR-5 TaxID=2835535 RepID=UPI001BDC0E06|nr:PLD nuclease N-terminal domain-containing protein [Paenarthrobacter sp. DKR-5]MBT1001281.1 PLDc N-terminal domain-containing protein [Paenarthrobacter sp. DKR-5]